MIMVSLSVPFLLFSPLSNHFTAALATSSRVRLHLVTPFHYRPPPFLTLSISPHPSHLLLDRGTKVRPVPSQRAHYAVIRAHTHAAHFDRHVIEPRQLLDSWTVSSTAGNGCGGAQTPRSDRVSIHDQPHTHSYLLPLSHSSSIPPHFPTHSPDCHLTVQRCADALSPSLSPRNDGTARWRQGIGCCDPQNGAERCVCLRICS